MFKRKLFIILGVLLTVFLIAKHYFINYEKTKFMRRPAPTIEAATAKQTKWQANLLSTGTISAINGIIIKPEVAGRITKIYFKSGSYVKKGQPLFQIYPDILAAQLASDQANLSLAQVEYQRAAELYQKKVASKQTLDEQTAKLKSAEAAVAATQAQLVQHNINAPFAGKIGLKQVSVGDYVNIGQSLVSLEQTNPLRIQFTIPDKYINQIKIKDKVDITVSSAPDLLYEGYVYAIDAAVNEETRLLSLWAKIPNPADSLVPGTYVQVDLFYGKPHPVLVVPKTAVLYSPQGSYVYRIKNGIANKRQITTGDTQKHDIEITQGLQAGDLVATSGQIKLFDGSPVDLANSSTYSEEKQVQIKTIHFKK